MTDRYFERPVVMGSRLSMIDFLRRHARADAYVGEPFPANTYANSMRIPDIGLTELQKANAFKLIMVPGYLDKVSGLAIAAFNALYQGQYWIQTGNYENDRLILMAAGRAAYYAYGECHFCGAEDFLQVPVHDLHFEQEKQVVEMVAEDRGLLADHCYMRSTTMRYLDASEEQKKAMLERAKRPYSKHRLAKTECSLCHTPLTKYYRPRMRWVEFNSGLDRMTDFTDWTLQELRERVRLVQHFDQVCDELRDNFIGMVDALPEHVSSRAVVGPYMGMDNAITYAQKQLPYHPAEH